MFEIKGRKSTAICYSKTIRDRAVMDIRAICDHDFTENRRIRIMPDVHPNGDGTVTGFTTTLGEPLVLGLEYPSGCGVSCAKINAAVLDLPKLDQVCRQFPASRDEFLIVPAFDYGFSVLRCYEHVRPYYLWPTSLGTLGGGNHFIELDRDDEGGLYLVVHNGLGRLGSPVLRHYRDLALRKTGKVGGEVELEDTFLFGQDMEDYIHDMDIIVDACRKNRRYIIDSIISDMGWKELDFFDTCHHCISKEDGVIRHGAVSAHKGERVIIPVNAKDGTILGTGKGNEEWNFSAPHGGGRVYSRSEAFENLDIEGYRSSMDGIYSTSVSEVNLDEAPLAYKRMDEILQTIEDSVDVQRILKPVFNYKGE